MKSRILQRGRRAPYVLWRGTMQSLFVLVAGGLLLTPRSVGAQQHAHSHGTAEQPAANATAHHASHSPEQTVSARAREQITAVEQAVASLKAPDAAAAEGFQPFLGMLPTMGVHHVDAGRLLDGVKELQPDVLMFSPVDGQQRLVGVAFGFLGQASDAPDLFDGTQDAWHDHPEFAPPGQTLVMLHVWFVPSPDGPFAGHNPWLGYWAAGVQPPADSVMADTVAGARARRLALALSETVEPLPVGLAQMGMGGLELTPGVAEKQDSIKAIIPRLNAARRAGDQAQWDREADTAIALWERIRDAYLEAIPIPDAREELATFYQQMATGKHEH